MTPPREPDRYEAKARELWHSLRTDAVQAVPAIAAALRAAERARDAEWARAYRAAYAGGRADEADARSAPLLALLAAASSTEAPPAKETRNAGLRSGSHADVATADRIDLQGHQSTDGNVVRGLLEEAREVADVLGEGHAADLVARIDVYLATPAPSEDPHPLSLRAEFEKYKKAEKRIAELEEALRGAKASLMEPYTALAIIDAALSRTASPGAQGKGEG